MITIIIVCKVLFAIYWYGTRTFNYWEKRGVKYEKPVPFFGTNTRNYFLKMSFSDLAAEMYNKYPEEKVVGFFSSTQPGLVIRDPQIIKRILITDFAHFYRRGPISDVIEPMLLNLFSANGDLWRLLRQRITPAFTSGKLKAMFPLIVERAERLQVRALESAAANRSLDARELMARYTTDFIGACGFGLDADSLNDDSSEFRKLGSKIFENTFTGAVIATLKEMFPKLTKHLKYFGRIENDVFSLVRQILKQRNYEPCGRNDFVDLLLECEKKGVIVGESIERVKSDGTPETTTLEFTEQLIVAQIFVFFAAGFETSSSATSFTLHQLAYNPEVQKKVQDEVDRVLNKYENKLCYDAVKEMTYLEWTFNEGMRMFPSLGFLVRECARPYTFEDLNMSIDPGVGIIIPLQALHNDPEYFDSPEEFSPERFDPKKFDSENTKFVYMPFGDGPRACIGARLGLMQSMAGMAAVLARFTVEPAPESLRHPIVDPASNVVQSVKDGLPLMFRERKYMLVDC